MCDKPISRSGLVSPFTKPRNGETLVSSELKSTNFKYERVVDEICGLGWKSLSTQDLMDVAWAYYHFSVQFRENLKIACALYPNDVRLRKLEREECNTDNLSPWPGIAEIGEKLDHDEFMRRLLKLCPIDDSRRIRLEALGHAYLRNVREITVIVRASSIASYEDRGLERVFRAILVARNWDGPLLKAFRHFLTEHIRFDDDSEEGHGALSRHLMPDDQILPLWTAFKDILIAAAPTLLT